MNRRKKIEQLKRNSEGVYSIYEDILNVKGKILWKLGRLFK
jgi:hypothetical protein